MYAAHLDAAIYGYYAAQLSNALDERINTLHLDNVVLAYRRIAGKNNVDFALDAIGEAKRRGDCFIIALDIKSFFESLDHMRLLEAVRSVLGVDRLSPDWFNVLRSVTRFRSVAREKIKETLGPGIPKKSGPGVRICTAAEFRSKIRPHVRKHNGNAGIPQGTPISAVLANCFMLELDNRVRIAIANLGGDYRRYSDDILIICPTHNALGCEDIIAKAVTESNLVINSEKTQRFLFQGGRICSAATLNPSKLDYLGLTWNGPRIHLRAASLQKFKSRMRTALRVAEKTATKKGADIIKRRRIYFKFSHLGTGSKRVGGFPRAHGTRHRSFYQYIRDTARKTDSPSLRRFLKRSQHHLEQSLEMANKRVLLAKSARPSADQTR